MESKYTVKSCEHYLDARTYRKIIHVLVEEKNDFWAGSKQIPLKFEVGDLGIFGGGPHDGVVVRAIDETATLMGDWKFVVDGHAMLNDERIILEYFKEYLLRDLPIILETNLIPQLNELLRI